MNYLMLLLKFIIIIFILNKFKIIHTLQILPKKRSQTNRSHRRINNNGDNISLNIDRRLNVNNNAVTRCELPILNNGEVKLRHRGKLIRFVCNKNYFLIGNTYAACSNQGKWDIDIPVCVKKGCSQTLISPTNGFITYERSNSIAHLYCEDGYTVAFGRISYCNGTTWDRPIGECRKLNSKNNLQRFCDFETEDICGWQQDSYDDLEWKRTTGVNIYKRVRTGPQHDHTTLKSYDGHYMLVESINRISILNAILISPIYPRNYSINSCFRFWYHMYGTTVGTLKVYVKPLSIDINSLIDNIESGVSFLHWEKTYNQGNHWYEALFLLEELEEDFQIIIEGTTGSGHLSDIAIDDVALLLGSECYLLEQSSTTVESTFRTTHESDLTTVIDDDYTTKEQFILGTLDAMICSNRCNETESLVNKSISRIQRVNNTNDFIIICDCHFDCQEMETCCLDYKLSCYSVEVTEDDQEQTESESTENYETTMEYMTTNKLTKNSIENTSTYKYTFDYKDNITLSTKSSNLDDYDKLVPSLETLSPNNKITNSTTVVSATATTVIPTTTTVIPTTTAIIPTTTANLISEKNSNITNIQHFITTNSKIHLSVTTPKNGIEIKVTASKQNPADKEEAVSNVVDPDEIPDFKKSSKITPTTISTTTTKRSDIIITMADKEKEKNLTFTESTTHGNTKKKNNISSLTILIIIVLIVVIFFITFIIGLLCSTTLKKLNSKKPQINFFNKKNKKITPLLQNSSLEYNNVRYLINDDELDFTLQTIELPTNTAQKEDLNLLTPSSSKSSTLTLSENYVDTEIKLKLDDSNQFKHFENFNDSNSNLLQNSTLVDVDNTAVSITTDQNPQIEKKVKEPSKKKSRKSFNNKKFDDNNEKNQLISSDVSNDDYDMWLQ